MPLSERDSAAGACGRAAAPPTRAAGALPGAFAVRFAGYHFPMPARPGEKRNVESDEAVAALADGGTPHE